MRRGKTFWYGEGYLYTEFFHATTTSKRKKHLENSNGTVCRKEEELQVIARYYFSHLFTKLPSTHATVISKVPTTITEEYNYSLTTTSTLE